ncbi:hypothetical protein DF186_25870, partial [Enterococcus hirae]
MVQMRAQLIANLENGQLTSSQLSKHHSNRMFAGNTLINQQMVLKIRQKDKTGAGSVKTKTALAWNSLRTL